MWLHGKYLSSNDDSFWVVILFIMLNIPLIAPDSFAIMYFIKTDPYLSGKPLRSTILNT